MDVEHGSASMTVVHAHSNQEYHIDVRDSTAVGPNLEPPLSTRCEHAYRCFKYSTITISVFVFTLFLVIPALVLPDISVESASSSASFNVSTSVISALFDVRIRVKNPSKYFQVKYKHVRATLNYDNKHLSVVSLNPFLIGKRKQATIRAAFELNVWNNRNSWESWALESSVSGGTVSIDIDLEVGRRIGLGKWWIYAFDLTVSCKDMIFKPLSSEGRNWALFTHSEYCDIGFFGYV